MPPSFLSRIGHAARAFVSPVLEERALPPPAAAFQSYGVSALFKPAETLKAFDDNVWLFGAVSRIAQELARTKFKLYTVNRKGEIEYVRKHQAIETLKRPQPTKGGKPVLTGMGFRLVIATHLLLHGEGFGLLDNRLKINGAPTSIEPLLPGNVRIVLKDGEITKYVYRTGDREVYLDPKDVVHFKIPDPADWLRGHSPVQSIRYSLDTHKEADVFNYNKFRNGAIPGGTLESEQAITPEERLRILREWDQRYGGSKNSNKTAMLPKGLKYNRTQETNQDMQFVEGKHVNREEILANYGVGPEMLGLTDSKTRANAEASIFVFMRFGALFYIETFADTLTHDYLPAFPGTDDMEYGFDDPVPENEDNKRANADSLFLGVALTPNERRKMFGHEPLALPGMDVPYLPINLMPLGQPPEPTVAPEATDTEQ